MDRIATQAFADDPASFVGDNFLKTAGQSALAATTTWTALGGGAASVNFHGGTLGTLDLAGAAITADDVLTVNSIANRAPPTVFVELETINEGFGANQVAKPNYFGARLYADAAADRAEALFLPARANQMSAIVLPVNGGPDICLTDPLSGCYVYFGTVNVGNVAHKVMCHANAVAVREDLKDTYFANLLTEYSQRGLANHTTLVKGTYRHAAQAEQMNAAYEKRSLGRTDVVAQADAYTAVYAIRKAGVWNAYYAVYADVKSARTGITKVTKGTRSHKSRVALMQI